MISTSLVTNWVALDTSCTLVTKIWLEWIRFLLMSNKANLLNMSHHHHQLSFSDNIMAWTRQGAQEMSIQH
jgi:hypothetical protein